MSKLVITLSTACVMLGGVACSHGSASKSADAGEVCTKDRSVAASRAFIDAKGFSPSCVKVKANSAFTIGNLDAKAHSVTTSADSPQSISANLPHKNTVFSVKLVKPGTYRVAPSGGGKTLTIFVQ